MLTMQDNQSATSADEIFEFQHQKIMKTVDNGLVHMLGTLTRR